MYCKNCLAPLDETDTLCKVCGKPVEAGTDLPNNEEVTYTTEPREKEENKVVESVAVEAVEPIKAANEVFTPNLEEKPTTIKPEPLPIVNKTEGISKKVYIISLGIAVVASMLIAILIMLPIMANKVNKAKAESPKTEVESKVVTETRALLNNYSFVIPEGYSYRINGAQLIVEKIDTKQAMSLQVGTETYTNIKSNLPILKNNLTAAKWIVGKIYTDTAIKNREYLTVEATFNNQKLVVAYTKASAKETFGIVYMDPSSTVYPEKTVEVFNDIVESAKEVTNKPTTTIANFTVNKMFFPPVAKAPVK